MRQLAAAGSALLLSRGDAFAAPNRANRRPICAFIKFIQSLSYDQMAQQIAEIGFDGIESTVRKGGHVLPERVEEDLPRQLEAVKNAGIDMTMITTDVLADRSTLHAEGARNGVVLGNQEVSNGLLLLQQQAARSIRN